MKQTIARFLALTLLVSAAMPWAFAEDAKTGPMTKDEVLSYYESVDDYLYEVTGSEFGYAAKGNSADLAWSESYVLQAFLTMYETTGDSKYLKDLGLQFRHAMSYLHDTLGNGKIGWDTPRYALQKAPNYGFENAEPDGTPTGWTVTKGKPQITDGGKSGKALQLSAAGVSVTIPTYMKGYPYAVWFDVKSESNAPVQFRLKNKKTGAIIPTKDGKDFGEVSGTSSWKYFEIPFVMPENGDPVELLITAPNADGSVLLENLSFKQVSQYLVHDAIIATPVASFIKYVKENPTLAATTFDGTVTFGQIADEFLPVVENLVTKWDDCWRQSGSDLGAYYWPDDESDDDDSGTVWILPHNQYIQMVGVLLPLYDITGNEKYLDRATRMLTFFKSKMQLITEQDTTFYFWNYQDRLDPNAPPRYETAEDISHGAQDLSMIFAGYERGLVFNEQDMEYLVNTFKWTLWNGNLKKPEFYRAIEYKPEGPAAYHETRDVENLFRDWIRLAKWEPKILDAFTTYLRTNSDPSIGHPCKLLTYAYAYELLCEREPFSDLGGYAWAADSINALAQSGVIRGTTKTTFSPAATITRADFTLLLVRSLGLSAEGEANFTDVSPSAYYAPQVGVAQALGMVKGDASGRFHPTAQITRQDMMVLLQRALLLANCNLKPGSISAFSDAASVAGYAKDGVGALVQAGIVKGSNGKLNPLGSTTRAEAAVILARTLSLIIQ